MAERRVAIITGGGTGIGHGIVQALSTTGIDCLVVGRRLEPLRRVAEALTSAHATVEYLVADVTIPEDRSKIIDTANDRLGRADILVNNAGGGNAHHLLDYPVDAWRGVLEVNLEAAFFLSQQALEGMRERAFGRIINIGSILGILGDDASSSGNTVDAAHPRGPIRVTAYNAAKAGLASMSRDLAVGVAGWGVTVNTISPGYIERPERPRSDQVLEGIAARVPMGRHGSPADIGHAAAFLASDGAGYITGHDLVVDGGRSIW